MQLLPPGTGDKRRAVGKLLKDPEWSEWSDRRIAGQADVSPSFVSNLRYELRGHACPIERRRVQRGESEYLQTVNLRPKGAVSRRVQQGKSEYVQNVNLRPERAPKAAASSATPILGAVSLLAKSDAAKFFSSLDDPQRERLLNDLPAARRFLDRVALTRGMV